MQTLSDRLNRLTPSATLAMSQRSAELKAQGVDVINMSVGEPNFNTPTTSRKQPYAPYRKTTPATAPFPAIPH